MSYRSLWLVIFFVFFAPVRAMQSNFWMQYRAQAINNLKVNLKLLELQSREIELNKKEQFLYDQYQKDLQNEDALRIIYPSVIPGNKPGIESKYETLINELRNQKFLVHIAKSKLCGESDPLGFMPQLHHYNEKNQ